MRILAGLILSLLPVVASPISVASAAVPPAEPIRPPRATAPPVLDGRLDDEIWRTAVQVSGFKTWLPDHGREPADQTIAYVAYDAENLYFAFRAFDSQPAQIRASVSGRDTIRPDDWICINLDSFNDQQALYGFYVNPLGIQMDSRYAAGKDDTGFDTVWYSAGRIDDQGYVIEMRLPFKSIRYRGGKQVSMGVVFERFVSRRREGSTSPALDPRAAGNFLIQTKPLVFSDIKRNTLLEILPAATYSRQDERREGTFGRASSGSDLGVSVKYGLTAQLTMDGTYNPDFSQVEADAGQVDINLRHPLFFAEKRPFFLEGNDVFNLAGPSQFGVLQSVIHTRTIVNPRAGLKVSGKVAPRDTMAVLYANDQVEGPAGPDDAHFSVLRYKRALNQDAYLGAAYVGREEGAAYNRVGGVDGNLRLTQSANVGFHAFRSDSRAAAADAEASAGHAVGVDFNRQTRRFDTYLAAYDVSKTFATDAGYLTRNGVGSLLGHGAIHFYPASRRLRRVDVAATTQQTRDAFSGIWETFNETQASLTFAGSGTAQASCAVSTEVFLGEEFGTSGCRVGASRQFSKQLRVQGSVYRGRSIYYASQPFGGMTTRASMTLVFQPSDQWSETLSLTYADFDRLAGGGRVYDYGILRSKTTYQLNRFLFVRGILEYNSFRRQLLTDLLASFTYIPGTVVHAGYGSLYERSRWDGSGLVRSSSLLEMRRGLFFKASYLWRV
jgi:hypothetical protein